MNENRKFHFVYLSYDEEGRFYIGKRSSENPYDSYMGSFKDDTFKPAGKIILGYFRSSHAAIQAEIQWQRILGVVESPEYVNRAYQTSEGFLNPGNWKHGEDSKKRIGEALKGRPKPETWKQKRRSRTGELAPCYGHKHSEETKIKMRESAKRPRKPLSEETKRKISESLKKRGLP